MSGKIRVLNRFLWLRFLLWLLVLLLLWWALRTIRPQEILATLSRLSWWQVGILLVTNAGLIFLFGTRWWLLIGAYENTITIPLMAGYWLAGFGIDYFTPGPSIGGEPLQVALLYKRQKMGAPLATAAVGIDRLVDATVNFAVLSICIALILHWQIFQGRAIFRTQAILVGLVLLLAAIIAALFRGHRLFGWLRWHLPDRIVQSKPFVFLQHSEQQLATLLLDHPVRIVSAVLVSLFIWIGFFTEYWLIAGFLDLTLTVPQLITAVAAHRLAFLLPLPGGLGALEASQVFAYQALALDPVFALSVALLIRARDVLVASFGLVWGIWLIGGWSQLRQIDIFQ